MAKWLIVTGWLCLSQDFTLGRQSDLSFTKPSPQKKKKKPNDNQL